MKDIVILKRELPFHLIKPLEAFAQWSIGPNYRSASTYTIGIGNLQISLNEVFQKSYFASFLAQRAAKLWAIKVGGWKEIAIFMILLGKRVKEIGLASKIFSNLPQVYSP